ncbi:DUF4270 family protein [Roseivirga misakiensis]|uniref:DUF4270 family protein n=1 Tax=Roseivirga misakiensis TaxID=1563681 RepID=UPI00159EFFAC|nr:DUF4270 family protein [Roseivirga misakiensis]
MAKIRIYATLILGIVIFNSCEEKGEFGLGSDDVAPIEFDVEEISLGTSLVWLDSIPSSSTGRLMVGEHVGSEFGTMQAKAFIALDLNESTHPTLEESVLDSTRINFRVSYLYDTASNRELSLRAYQIGEEFKDTTYITRNELAQTNMLLASGDVMIDKFDSTYSIGVDETWSTQIFEGIRNGDVTFDTQDAFDDFFPGFVLRHEGASNNIFGLSIGATFEMVFYYSDPVGDGSGDVVNKTITMNSTGMPNFHNFTIDRSATDFSVVQETNVVYGGLSRLTVQSGAGVVTRLDLSDFQRFNSENDGVIVNLSEIKVGPIGDLPEGVFPPPVLFMALTDERNSIIPDGSGFRSIQRDGANVLSDDAPVQLIYNTDDRTYTASLTTYTQAYLSDIFRRNEVFLYPTNMSLSVNGLTVAVEDVQLKIFFSQLR